MTSTNLTIKPGPDDWERLDAALCDALAAGDLDQVDDLANRLCVLEAIGLCHPPVWTAEPLASPCSDLRAELRAAAR